MPYPIDEFFLSGIPAGFASVGAGGGLTVTHNAVQEAVDLVSASGYQSVWHMLQAEFSTDFWFEIDVELVAKSIGQWHFGFWLYSNQATSNEGNYEGHRYAYNIPQANYPHYWQRSSWTNGGTEYNNGNEGHYWGPYTDNWPAAGAGQRRTLRLDARRGDLVGGHPLWLVRVTVDGVLVMTEYRRDRDALRPGIFLYGCTLRIHGVKGTNGSSIDVADVPIEAGNIGGTQAGAVLGPDHLRIRKEERTEVAVPARHELLPLLSNGPYTGGGKITGTVKQKAGSTNTPVWRRVVLADETTLTVVRETWSDPVTGAYEFSQVKLGRPFTVFSYDHTGGFRAVVADSVVAVPL